MPRVNDELLSVERRSDLTPAEFFASYCGKRPVVMAGLISQWPAVSAWQPEYWQSHWGALPVRVKHGDVRRSTYVEMTFGEYVTSLREDGATKPSRDSYLHNYALLHRIPELLRYVQPFPADFLPAWYENDWWRPMQFFFGPRDSVTPLHFDGYGTHGFLFQVTGRKRILLVDAKDRSKCYMTKFFWSPVDAENPDLRAYPRFADVVITECVTRPGDLVYWPPWTLHQVRNLEIASSFSLEWHDRSSVVKALLLTDRKAPSRMLRLNVAHALGLWLHVPKRFLYPIDRFYFDSAKNAGILRGRIRPMKYSPSELSDEEKYFFDLGVTHRSRSPFRD